MIVMLCNEYIDLLLRKLLLEEKVWPGIVLSPLKLLTGTLKMCIFTSDLRV